MPDILNNEIREQLSEMLYLRERLKDLRLLSHTLPKESKMYDEVITEKTEISKKLNDTGFSSTITKNSSLLSILVYMYEHPLIHITHNLFDEDEYIYYDDQDSVIKDENGSVFEDWSEHSTSYNGIMIRYPQDVWKYGWYIK